MEIYSYLFDIVVIFGAALAVMAVCRHLRIPPVVSLLLTGCLAGPYGAKLVRNPAHVEVFAELGIVFLLFEIGLELSFGRLRSLGRFFLIGGGFQAAGTVLAAMLVVWLAGCGVRVALFWGLVLCLSSTAIVLRLYSDRSEVDAPHGAIATGILLFQDILLVPCLLIVPLLGNATAAVSIPQLLLRFAGGLVVLTAAFAVGRWLVPRALHYIAATRIHELFVIGALFLCLGTALATQALGFSLALGAFLAGVLIAESDYHFQVVAETIPFREVFNSLFFISIGMLLRPSVVMGHAGQVALAVAAIMLLKGLVLFATVRLLSFPPRVAVMVALGLCQIGEFSFVLLQAGKASGVADEWLYQLAIASAIITMALTPVLIRYAPAIAAWLYRSGGAEPADVSAGPNQHVIVVGFGLAGYHLARVLKEASIPYVVVEMNGATVKKAKLEGEPIFFGDASRESILAHCGVCAARVIVFVISDPLLLRRGVRLARQMNPDVFIIVRTRRQTEIAELRACGADEVVSEEFETSIEIFTNVLTRLRIPGNIIRTQTRLLRVDDYTMLRSSAPAGRMLESVTRALNIGTTDTFLLSATSIAVGQTIQEMDLRRRTGVSIIALVRNDVPQTNPVPETRITAGDVLVLFGSHAQVDAAFAFLGQEKTG
jgi:CPA2 family monovalent cation:H+ antiporter-2